MQSIQYPCLKVSGASHTFTYTLFLPFFFRFLSLFIYLINRMVERVLVDEADRLVETAHAAVTLVEVPALLAPPAVALATPQRGVASLAPSQGRVRPFTAAPASWRIHKFAPV